MGALLGIMVYLAAAAVAINIGNKKGRPALGVVLGLLLSWIGVVIIALVPARRRTPTLPPGYAGTPYGPPPGSYYAPPPGYYPPQYAPPAPVREESVPQAQGTGEPDWTELRPR